MSRLFGFMCNEPERLACALHPARESLVCASAPDGWGLAFFQGGEVLLQRHPKAPPGPLDFFQQVRELRTDYLVGQVRDPGVPAKLENTQPFRFRSWVYAQSGLVPSFGSIQAGLLEHVPDFLRRNIRGQADAEHVFHVFLSFLHDDGKLDDGNIRTVDVQNGLRATSAMLDRLASSAGEGPLGVNQMVTNGRILLAVRRQRPMWLRKASGISDCRVCRDGAAEFTRTERRRVAHEHLRSVLLASEPEKLGTDGWEEVPENSIISVSRDLAVSLMPLRATES